MILTNSLKRYAALICLVASTGLMVSCTQSQVSFAFTAFTDAVEGGSIVATAFCGAGTIPAPICTILLPALSNAAAAAPQIQTELASSDPLALQVTKCIALLAPFVNQTISGSPLAQEIIAGIGVAAQALIAELQKLIPAAQALDRMNAHVGAPAHIPYAWKDRRTLSAGVKKSQEALARIAAYQAAHPAK